MTTSTLGEALKAFRRDTYLHKGEPYILMIVTPTNREARMVFQETRSIMDGSSLRLAVADHMQMKMLVCTGPQILVRSFDHRDQLRGLRATCVIKFGSFTEDQQQQLAAWNRAPLSMDVHGL